MFKQTSFYVALLALVLSWPVNAQQVNRVGTPMPPEFNWCWTNQSQGSDYRRHFKAAARRNSDNRRVDLSWSPGCRTLSVFQRTTISPQLSACRM